MASAYSYDISIRLANGPAYNYIFGPYGKLDLSHALKEPSAPSRVDTILIQSLHHGVGRKVATDPEMLRDSNGQQVGADTRQLGMVMPSGALTLLDTIAINEAAAVETLKSYAAVFTEDDGHVVFGAGTQIIRIDVSDDSVVGTTELAANQFFTGSNVEWNRDIWMGVENASYTTIGAYNYDDDTLNTTNTYMFSWAQSNRNAIFWIRNRSGAAPEFRWSDRTDQDFGAFNANFIYPNATNAFILEIPKASVTGMGVAGQYVLFTSKGGNVWGFDRNEVFIPLSPASPGGFIDQRFGGQMQYVGSWLLAPNLDGVARFDPRNISLTDISPSVHQAATPGIGTGEDKSIHAASPTPTGAMVAANFIGDDINILALEMYEDGMFYHMPLLNLDTDEGGAISRVWGIIVTHAKSGSDFTSTLVCYILASDDGWDNWLVYRLDVATASWAPGPASIAATSGFRTGFYTTRPPDVNASATQIRGYAQASEANSINLWLEVDDDSQQYPLPVITSDGPFVLPVPNGVLPGRKFALAGNLNVSDDSADPCFIQLPLSIDYRYVETSDPNAPDFFTMKFQASSDQINKISSRVFSHGRSEASALIQLTGQEITVGFADNDRQWTAIVEEAQAEMIEQEDGRTSTNYLVTMVCRRTS